MATVVEAGRAGPAAQLRQRARLPRGNAMFLTMQQLDRGYADPRWAATARSRRQAGTSARARRERRFCTSSGGSSAEPATRRATRCSTRTGGRSSNGSSGTARSSTSSTSSTSSRPRTSTSGGPQSPVARGGGSGVGRARARRSGRAGQWRPDRAVEGDSLGTRLIRGKRLGLRAAIVRSTAQTVRPSRRSRGVGTMEQAEERREHGASQQPIADEVHQAPSVPGMEPGTIGRGPMTRGRAVDNAGCWTPGTAWPTGCPRLHSQASGTPEGANGAAYRRLSPTMYRCVPRRAGRGNAL